LTNEVLHIKIQRQQEVSNQNKKDTE